MLKILISPAGEARVVPMSSSNDSDALELKNKTPSEIDRTVSRKGVSCVIIPEPGFPAVPGRHKDTKNGESPKE